MKKNKGVIDISEANTSVTAGLYNGPIELGLKKWKNETAPFNNEVSHSHNKKAKKSKMKDNVLRTVGVWEKGKDGSYHIPTHDAGGKKQKKKTESLEEWLDRNQNVLYEDLAVWFGTKKKPKGSKQPKGPWVNICRKDKNGKHPPCGRPEATDKAYPKCRAAGVAGKMSDSEKRSACQQKRRAEKSNPKSGTGNKPKLVSYKPRNEIKITEQQLERLIAVLTEQSNDYKWTPTTSDQKTIVSPDSTVPTYTKSAKYSYLEELANYLYNVRNNAWKDSLAKTVFNDKSDVTYLSIAILDFIKKNPNFNVEILKLAISLIFRESKGSFAQVIRPKELLGFVHNLFGGDHSQGYAQIQPTVAKQYGLDLSSLYTLSGSLEAAYKMLESNYNYASKFYSGPTVSLFKNKTLTQSPALGGDAALHMAAASHNGGLGIIGKWCETNIQGIANKCKVEKRAPWEKEKPKLFAFTNTKKEIKNYLPNPKGASGFSLHEYMPQFITAYNSLNELPKFLQKL